MCIRDRVILALKMSRPQFLNALIDANDWLPRTFHAELWLVALVSAAVCLLFRRENLAAAVLLAGLSLYPFKMMLYGARYTPPGVSTSTTTLNEIRYVLQNSSPNDTCMDGWTGLGVFRPHASFYWFLHVEIRAMLDETTKNEFAANLTSGSMAPKLIFYDEDLQGLSAETAEFFEKRYESTGEGPIRRRKGQEPDTRPAEAASASMNVSVVIPVDNERAFIEEILLRVQAAPLDKEIIVIDDGSTDGTRVLLQDFARTQSEGR